MRVIHKEDIERILPHARKVGQIQGPLYSADDCSIVGLAFAHVNFELNQGVGGGWCKCKPEPKDEVYYCDKNSGFGRHGWICVNCMGITQTG